MAIISGIKGFFGYGDEDFEEDDYEEEEEEEKASSGRGFFRSRRDESDDEPAPRRNSKVVPITGRGDRTNVQIVAPTMPDDARKAAEVIMNRRVLILNVTKMRDVSEATRVVDFVSGAVYGLRGNIKKVNDGIFVAAPGSIDISGDNIKDHAYSYFNSMQ